MVGDGVILVPAGPRRQDHLLERFATVRVGRVRVQIPFEILQLDEFRELAFARRLELARVFAQLGRDELVAETLVHLLLLGELQLFARLDDGDRVLGHGQAVLHRALAQRHVVVL